MATKAKKPAAKKTATVQSKTDAGAAAGERSRGAAKPAFGKAAPRKVMPALKSTVPSAKPASKSAKSSKGNSPSLATKIAQVATGAVVATAKLAASVVGKSEGKSKTK